MGTDVTYEEWHLTPRGWVAGGYSANSLPITSTNPPADRVETWIDKQESHDVYSSRIYHDWKLRWSSDVHSDEERRKLRSVMRKPAPESDDPHRSSWNFPT